MSLLNSASLRAAEVVRVFQVDQPAHLRRGIADGDPAGADGISAGAEVNQVVMRAGRAGIARRNLADELALVQVDRALEESFVELIDGFGEAEGFVGGPAMGFH